MKPIKRFIVVLIFLINHAYSLPIHAMAKEWQLSNQNEEIETPQTRLSPEIKMPFIKGTRSFSWIAEHKWWLIAGVSALTGGIILLNSRDNPDNKTIDDIDDNSTTDVGENGYGQISGKW
ncbi:MAG: hypothetical protein KJ737_22775 [Proteobacteria bacterium]|nr:hypothetical protein [Pseudomonadota bacterium]